LNINELVGLIERNELIEFGKEYKNERNKREIRNEVYRKLRPLDIAQRFLELKPDEINKLALIVAAIGIADGLKTTQIRKILSISRRIYLNVKQNKDISADIAKLRYIMAYISSRHEGARIIAEVADKIISKLNAKNYENFHDFLQAVVAYHKFMGGKD